MRNLDERMAEITRRSQARLNQRKKRRAAVSAVCVPVILCAVLVVFLTPPPVDPIPGTEPLNNNSDPGPVYENLSPAVVEISGNGVSLCRTDASAVSRVTQIIDSITKKPAVTSQFSETASDSLHDEAKEMAGYTIALTDAAGTVTKYALTGFTLTDISASIKYELTEREYTALMQALDLPAQ